MARVSGSKLLKTAAGILRKDAFVVIVRTEWNADIVDELEKGCIETLKNKGVRKVKQLTVPGAFEIPFAIKNHWENSKKKDRPHAYIALGCVLRGDTPHFDYVCKAITDGVVQLNLLLPVPSIFGVLTVDNHKQAEERIGGAHGHKGEEAGVTAVKMISLMK